MAAKSERRGPRAARAVRWATEAGKHDTQARENAEAAAQQEDEAAEDSEEGEGETLHENLVREAANAGLSAREAGTRVSADDTPHKAKVQELRERRRRDAQAQDDD